MKTFLWILFMVCSLTSSAQVIYLANNNPGAVTGTRVFTGNSAIADAITAAANGDIIYVVPSGSLYNAVNVTKSVTIFGAGFYPDKTNAVTSKCQNILVSADNVRLSGLVISPMVQVGGNVNNTMIDKCRINRISLLANAGNVIIQNCVVGENTSGQYSIYGADLTNTGLRISNNLIYGTWSGGFLDQMNNVTIENNVFVGISGFPAYDAFNRVQGCNIKNNIFYGVQPRGSNTANYLNNIHRYNLSFGATDNTFVSGVNGNTESNNIVNSDPLFVNLPLAAGAVFYTNSVNAQLDASSPAKNTGELGTDRGVFGGSNPFDPFGTSLPVVQTVVAPATVTQGTNMDVRVTGKGN